MTLATGTKLGHYEIGALIGAGGMGEVYRARDSRIGREVAIKIIIPEIANDPGRLLRFEQEARTVGALNHPNLVTLYDLGSIEGSPYLVMELLEGETLREKMIASTDRLSMRRAVDYAVQIAEGLAAAHQKGVVHRDLKPENIFVTRDGRVKILDFGLAKLAPSGGNSSGESETLKLKTAPGTVMGTVGYMSPEQVRGEEVDHRSDIFSFGAVLYEMLSGSRVFKRDTDVETMTAILREDPPDLPLAAAGVSRTIEAVTRHCLEKAREDRFQSARDLAFDLSMYSSSTEVALPVKLEERPKRSWLRGAVAALVLLGLAGAYGVGRLQRRAARPPVRQSTLTYSGADSDPAVSADGSMIAFSSLRDGVSRIWLKQLNGGGEAVLTSGPDSLPRFSPDGSSILFIRGRDLDGALYRIPVLGGEPRRIVRQAAGGDWSPDGRQVAFVRPDVVDGRAQTIVGIVEAKGEDETIIATIPRPVGRPRWSPDGKTITFASAVFGNGPRELCVIGLDGKMPPDMKVPQLKGLHSTLSWVDDHRVVYSPVDGSTNLVGGSSSTMLLLDLRKGTEEVLFHTATAAATVDVGPDGSIIYDAIAPRANMREVVLATNKGSWLSRGHSTDRQPAYSPDGQWVAFSSNMSGNLDIWARSTSTGTLRRITDHDDDDFDPAFTRDGKSILWSSRRSGHYEIWTASADGTGARQLSRDGADAENPTMTPDGWVIYNSYHPEKKGIWRIRPDGTGAERLLAGVTELPDTSPDGAHVSYHLIPTNDLMVLRLSDRKTFVFQKGIDFANPATTFGRSRWTSDGKGLIFSVLSAENEIVLVQQTHRFGVDTASTRRAIAGLDASGPPESFAVSPDGTKIAVSHSVGETSIQRSAPIEGLARRK